MHVTSPEICIFIGIMVLSGYVRLPSYTMYWEEALDVQPRLVKNAMRRNRFQEILCYLHFCDNSSIDTSDKCSKVRPLLNMLQERCKKYAILTKTADVDESMIPYYGKFGQASNNECL